MTYKKHNTGNQHVLQTGVCRHSILIEKCVEMKAEL